MKIVKTVNEKFRVVLASASPRRSELLRLTGMEFEVWPSQKEEPAPALVPAGYCTHLSRTKALDVAAQIKAYNDSHPELTTATDILVAGADTIVAKGDLILGKPADEDNARSMLRLLSGDCHSVYTGVTLVFISREGRVGEHTFYEETKVTFYPLSDEDIDDYVSTGDPLDKAGSYGIQSGAAPFVKCIEGDYCNVVGLPIGRMLKELSLILDSDG